MRLAPLTAAALGAVAIATIGIAGTASAADSALIEYTVSCEDNGGFIDLAVDIDSDNPGEDRFLVELDGVVLDDDLPAGDSGWSDLGPFEDGVYQLRVETDPGGDLVIGWQIPVACEGPLVEVLTQCEEEGGASHFIDIGFWSTFDDTADVYIDGVLVVAALESNDLMGFYGYGPYPVGDHLVEIDWLNDKTDDPYFSATVSEDCIDDDSGAGIPDAGSETTPLLIGATALTLGGIALLGTRRLRRA